VCGLVIVFLLFLKNKRNRKYVSELKKEKLKEKNMQMDAMWTFGCLKASSL